MAKAEHNLLVVSDLHLSEGWNKETGKFFRLEDFFFDDAFDRFLRYHEAAKEEPRFGGRPWVLVINGDLFDFLQVVSKPQEGEPLRALTGVQRYRQLRRNEQDYGLGTTARESAWKLKRIGQGHRHFFAALGWFLAHGNRLVVVKGNHDVELHWEKVQQRLVQEIDRAYQAAQAESGAGPPISADQLRARVHFYPWFYHEPERVYIEHGNQYEPANYFRDFLNPVLPHDPTRIELPWGSLIVRYVFNQVEDVHPFADNVKPFTRYLAWAFKEDPIKALEVFVIRGWVFLRALWTVGQKTVQTLTHRSAAGARQAGGGGPVPLPPEVATRIAELARWRAATSWREWVGSAVQGLLSLAMAVNILIFLGLAALALIGHNWLPALGWLVAAAAAYFLRRALARSLSQLLRGSSYLLRTAQEIAGILGEEHRVHYLVLGHDHQARVERLGETAEGPWYVNTGAWVPVYEEEGPVEGREQLTFFRLAWAHEGPPELLRWDDAAGAPARVVLW